MKALRTSVGASTKIALITLLHLLACGLISAATQIHLTGPAGSGSFGSSVTTLPNGNVVVSDPSYDSATNPNVGAVYLYSGATGQLISVLTGDTDQISELAEDRSALWQAVGSAGF